MGFSYAWICLALNTYAYTLKIIILKVNEYKLKRIAEAIRSIIMVSVIRCGTAS